MGPMREAKHVQINIIAWCPQVITGYDVNLDRCLNMASLNHGELNENHAVMELMVLFQHM